MAARSASDVDPLERISISTTGLNAARHFAAKHPSDVQPKDEN